MLLPELFDVHWTKFWKTVSPVYTSIQLCLFVCLCSTNCYVLLCTNKKATLVSTFSINIYISNRSTLLHIRTVYSLQCMTNLLRIWNVIKVKILECSRNLDEETSMWYTPPSPPEPPHFFICYACGHVIVIPFLAGRNFDDSQSFEFEGKRVEIRAPMATKVIEWHKLSRWEEWKIESQKEKTSFYVQICANICLVPMPPCMDRL